MAKKKVNSRKVIKKNSLNNSNKTFISIALIIFGIVSFISLYSTKMGIFGIFIYKIFSFLSGSGNFLFPILFIITGSSFLIKKELNLINKYNICLFIISICILIFLDGTKMSDITLIDRLRLSIEYLDIATSGGIIGSILGFFFYKIFGSVGTYLILSIIILISLFFIFKSSFNNFEFNKFWNSFINNLKLKKKKKENETDVLRYSNEFKNSKAKKIEKEEKITFEDEVLIKEFNSEYNNLESDKLEKGSSVKNNTKKTNLEVSEIDKEIDKNDFIDNYIYPPIELLDISKNGNSISKDEIIKNGKIIENTMENFGIDCKIVAINKGPVITCYELEPAPGVKLSRIVSLSDNLSMALASSDIRIEAPIPGKSAVGIEVPNKSKESVTVREIIESKEFSSINSNLPLALGKDVAGKTIISTIDKMPHLLIAGATGSGKSVCINSIITSILYKASPKDVKLMLIDPKVVELSIYNGIPHLLIPVVTDPKKAAFALNWAVGEMERRYKLFAESSVRDLKSYNKKMNSLNEDEYLPQIVVIVDELADLMMVAGNEVEDYIARLAQMARAAGIYLIIATQRPSVDVITGTIKANIPSRIAFAVSSAIDSRTILDLSGAEKLLGKGDMLFYPTFYSKPVRLQCAYISDEEVEQIVNFVKINSNEDIKLSENNSIVEEIEKSSKKSLSNRDPLFEDALEYILIDEQASVSFLQRKLKIGYSRAARIVDQLEEAGIIGPPEGSKPRKLLLSKEEIDEILGGINE